MLIKPDCISCILKMANTAIRNLTADESVIKDLTVQILTIPSLRGLQWDLSCPEVIEQVMEKIITAFQNPDPFRALKLEQNRVGQSLYPTLKKLVREADLVISKGGGNFDALEGEKDLGADISFLMLSKCIPYCQYFQTGMFQPILTNFFAS